MKKILLALSVLLITNAWAGIGVVSNTKGTICEIQRGKSKLPGAKGAEVESMDTYTTGACVSDITFKDDTKVKVSENSRLLIDDFVYDPKKSDAGKLAIKAAMGTVRYTSGQIAKNNPQQVNIKTPTATVAVRGTDFNMTVDEIGQSLIVLLPNPDGSVGMIDVKTAMGVVTLNQAFQATVTTSSEVKPMKPVLLGLNESMIDNMLIVKPPKEILQRIQEEIKNKSGSALEFNALDQNALNVPVFNEP